jgi:hypothetical protein
MSYSLNYLGGIPELKKAGDVTVNVTSDYISVSAGLFAKVAILYSAVSDVSLKTDEQISKDVTITRLLLLNIFAFGLKKKTKTTTYNLVIEYSYNGIQTAAVFSGNNVPQVNSDIMKRRAAYLKKHPVAVSTPAAPTVAETPTDAAAEIGKFKGLLDAGAITPEEYEAKKKQLLGL